MNEIAVLFRHAWLGFTRSRSLGHKLLENLFMAIIGLNIAVSLSVAGLVGGTLIRQTYPEASALHMGLGFLVYYFIADILVRYFFQKFPVTGLRPYLVLPLSRKTIVHSLLLRSLPVFWNFLPWFLAIPFFLTEVRHHAPELKAGFVVVIAALTLINNYFVFAIGGVRAYRVPLLALMGVLVGVLYLEFSGTTSFALYLGKAAYVVMDSIWLQAALVAVLAGMYAFLLRSFMRELSAESEQTYSKTWDIRTGASLFGRLGVLGELMDLEVRLILRNKRARAYAIMSVVGAVFLPIYFIVQGGDELSNALIFFAAFLMTGLATLNHGQLILSWNSLHFDFLLLRSGSLYQMLRAKYFALAGMCVFLFLLTLPISLYEPRFFWPATAALFINASISAYVYLFLATVSSLWVDPNEGGTMSFNGFGMAHYLIVFPILVVPMALYGVGYQLYGHDMGVAWVGAAGVVLFLLHQPILRLITRNFSNTRYRIAATLRNP